MSFATYARSGVRRIRAFLLRIIGPAPLRIKLGRRYVGKDEPVFIIAEIGINHNGDPTIARTLIDKAVEAGADCVKFQMRDLESLYVTSDARDMKENLNTQYSLDLLTKMQLSPAQLFELFDYAKSRGVFPLCTPFDLKSVERLEAYGMDAYKIGSPDLTNHDLIAALVKTGKPLIVSTGMSDERDIASANALLRKLGAKYILLHVNSTYPAPFQDIQLQLMQQLGTAVYGYSGHERGTSVAIAAVARGAKVIEKHITLDRNMEGTDHKASLLPDEFRHMVEGIRQVELSMGTQTRREMTQGERMNRANLAKSVIASRDLRKGERIDASMLDVKSPGRGLQPNRKQELIGRTARRDMKTGEPFFPSDLLDKPVLPRAYTFSRPWGIPVRFHDFKKMLEVTNLDFIEFHMSYRDLDIDPATICSGTYNVGLVVHGVETYANDHILNLASDDAEYRTLSIQNLQRCIDQTRALKQFFPKTERPMIVVNAGGYTRTGHVPPAERIPMYARIADSLSQLDTEGVELIIQTMPPYPWLLGGQMYHNLFVDPEDTANFCMENNIRLCFDVSHSYLAANHLSRTLSEYCTILGPYIAYLHIVDGDGVGEEGLQIGYGTINFKQLGNDLRRVAPNAPFIPEIWQGHENGGEGFWYALERLEKTL
jgi:sialic acid synthase SpsE/sugar phosphate isomerase/epimerase